MKVFERQINDHQDDTHKIIDEILMKNFKYPPRHKFSIIRPTADGVKLGFWRQLKCWYVEGVLKKEYCYVEVIDVKERQEKIDKHYENLSTLSDDELMEKARLGELFKIDK